jgi:hypothetical protein
MLINWRSSEVSWTSTGDGLANIGVAVNSNREIHRALGGHFRVVINATRTDLGAFNATSDCFEIGAGVAPVLSLLQSTQVHFSSPTVALSLGNSLNISVKRTGDGKAETNFQTAYNITFSSPLLSSILTEIDTAGCTPIETIARWSDANNWDSDAVPNSGSVVHIPEDAGFIQLTNNVEVAALEMKGGKIIADNSPCPAGWSLSPAESRLG